MFHLLVGKQVYGWQLLAYQVEVERRLHLALVNIQRKVRVQIQRHQQVSLVRQFVPCGTCLTFHNHIALGHSRSKQTLHGGIAPFECRTTSYLVARRQRMIVQKLQYLASPNVLTLGSLQASLHCTR